MVVIREKKINCHVNEELDLDPYNLCYSCCYYIAACVYTASVFVKIACKTYNLLPPPASGKFSIFSIMTRGPSALSGLKGQC